jgi:hypothetical protein
MALLVLPLTLTSGSDRPPGWRFSSERVRMTVEDGWFEIDGHYVFERSGPPKALSVDYPFAGTPGPEDITVLLATMEGEGDPSPLDLHWLQSGIRFELPGSDKSDAVIHIRYRQSIDSGTASYFLRTAAGWASPLDSAQIEVCLPAGRPARMTPRLTRVYEDSTITLYRRRYRDWRPTEDLEVTMSRPLPRQVDGAGSKL